MQLLAKDKLRWPLGKVAPRQTREREPSEPKRSSDV